MLLNFHVEITLADKPNAKNSLFRRTSHYEAVKKPHQIENFVKNHTVKQNSQLISRICDDFYSNETTEKGCRLRVKYCKIF